MNVLLTKPAIIESDEKKAYRRNIWKACLFKFLYMFHLIAGVLIPFFTIWGGIKFSQVMILNAIFFISIFIFEVPMGAIADRFGRKTTLALAGIVGSLAAVVYSSYPNFWVFILGEILWGLGAALVSGADQALVYDSLIEIGEEERSKKIFGQWNSLGLISIGVAAPIGSLIAKYAGLRFAVLFMAIPMFLAACVALTMKEPLTGKKISKTGYFHMIREGFVCLRGNGALKILAFDYVSISALSFFIIWVYQVVLQKLGVPIAWFGFVCTGIVLAEVFVLNSFSTLDKLFGGKSRYSFFSALIIGISFIGMAITRNVALTVLFILLISAFGLTRGPLFQNYMNKFIESHNRATVLSVVSMFYSLSTAFSNIIFGYMVDWNLKIALVVIGSLMILLALFSKVEEEHLLN